MLVFKGGERVFNQNYPWFWLMEIGLFMAFEICDCRWRPWVLTLACSLGCINTSRTLGSPWCQPLRLTGRWAKTPLTLKLWAQNEKAEVPCLARIQISIREPQQSEEGAHFILPERFSMEQAFSSVLVAAWRSDSPERAFAASENDLFCKVNDLER